MPKLFSSSNRKFLKQVDRPEKELNRFICENWNDLFPSYLFIASEFPLKGNVRSLGNNGRIDILAYNPVTKKFVVFELKKEYDRNITDQAADYRDYIQDTFSDVYLHSSQKYGVDLPKFTEINQDGVEIVLIAKRFSLTQIDRVKKIKDGNVTLIRYFWFENNLIFIDYVNNDPDDAKIESVNARKISDIKNIIEQDPEMQEIDSCFGKYNASRALFLSLFTTLKSFGAVELNFSQTRIRVKTPYTTFSAVRAGGQGTRKTLLQVNTDFDVRSLPAEIQVDDRFAEKYTSAKNGKPKGSLGSERYEVFLRNDDETRIFGDFVKSSLLGSSKILL